MVSADAIAAISWFHNLRPTTLQQVAEAACIAVFPAGGRIYAQGGPPTGLYILQSGRVKLYRQSQNRTQILALLTAGECCGAESLVDDTASPYTATALTPVTAIYIPPQALRDLLLACPDFQEAFLEVVTARLRQFVALVHDLAFRDVTARLAAILLTRVRAEGQPTEEGIRIDRVLSQQDLAAMVGTAREVIYRTFKKFEQEGVIRLTSDSIFILNLNRLTEVAAQEVH